MARTTGAVSMPKLTKAQLTKKPAFGRLKKLLNLTSKRDLLWYFDVGKCVHSLVPSENRAYGEGRIEQLAVALGMRENYGATLWGTRSFFEKYDRPDVRVLRKPQTAGGFVLAWAHMINLISMDDEDRLEFQEKCLSEEWSSKELRQWIKAYREPQGHGGRRFQKPKDVEAALRQLIHESRTWDRRYHEIWFHMDEPAIRLESGKYKSEEVSVLAAAAVEELKTLQSDINEGLLRLKALNTTPKKTKRRARKRG